MNFYVEKVSFILANLKCDFNFARIAEAMEISADAKVF